VLHESQGPVVKRISAYASRLKRRPARPATVLIVDDEEPVRNFVERVLRDAGYKTAVAADGPEAIDIASKLDSLDVLVADVMMPQMMGDELGRRLRQREPGLKVLYLTGYSDRLFKEKVTLWEGEAFLDKPCSVKGLLEAVSLLLLGHIERSGERSH
jgi:two-component system cell cycle sensor histidine kinase/response regulator CckA